MAPLAPLRVHLELENLDSLFDLQARATYPHSGRMLDAGVAEHLEYEVREHRRVGPVEIDISLRTGPGSPAEQEAASHDLHSYFEAERKVSELELGVNQREGWAFTRRTFPFLVAALAVAGILYVYEPNTVADPVRDLLTALLYLLFITIVWVLLWDPIEKLVFDAFLLRSRLHALAKLSRASVRIH